MLAGRIHNTLRFFDLQNYPLTSWEIQSFLISDLKSLQEKLDGNFELQSSEELSKTISSSVHLDTILTQLRVLKNEKSISEKNGFYCLAGREDIITERQKGYLHGLKRERLINRYAWPVRYIPFVRSVALLGSQAQGLQKRDSDIDLFVITDERFIGIARFFLTVYFQVLVLRRHGRKIANRFCLNHYLAGTKLLSKDRNLYTALEYLKHRSLVGEDIFLEFLRENKWTAEFFPNFELNETARKIAQAGAQKSLEKLFNNPVGKWLEQTIISAQLRRINEEEFNIKNREELSFHPNNRKAKLFAEFFNIKI